MHRTPLLSVLLPTKNRSSLVASAVRSVLEQDFHSVEVIVADNDSTDSTASALAHFRDPKLRYFRTGGLSMADNWEFAFRQTRGAYITVLEDKAAYRPGTLRVLEHLIREKVPQLVCWGHDIYAPDQTGTLVLTRRTYDNHLTRHSTRHALDSFLTRTSPLQRKHALPRSLNSLCRRDIAETIRTKSGRFFHPLSPDFTSAFLQLAQAHHVWVLNHSLTVFNMEHSNGISFRLHPKKAQSFITESGFQLQDVCNYVPIKYPYSLENTLFNDFLAMSQKSPQLRRYELHKPNYYTVCHLDISRTSPCHPEHMHGKQQWIQALQQEHISLRLRVNLRRHLLTGRTRATRAWQLATKRTDTYSIPIPQEAEQAWDIANWLGTVSPFRG